MEQFADFHFLRPVWLLLILGAVALYWLLERRENLRERWGKVIAPHLLEHLIVGKRRRWHIRPVHLACLSILLGAIALAGPTWEREVPPFTEDKAPMVIVLALSQSMDAIDIQPTRLERAKQKIRDLLVQRSGAKNALLVYAGTAHLVLPLTEDPAIMELFLSSLSTRLMPVPGMKTALALKAAEGLLKHEDIPGSILFVTDAIERQDFPAFREHAKTSSDQVLVLGVGTSRGGPISLGENRFLTKGGRRVISRLDIAGLRALGEETGIPVTTLTPNDDDIKWIARRAQTHLKIVQQAQAQTRWRDFGYYLVFPLALLVALWFRRGWTVGWASGLLLLASLSATVPARAQLPVQKSIPGSTSVPSEAGIDTSKTEKDGFGLWLLALWLTPDQQGRYYFEKGDYDNAAKHFKDPLWKGIALYRSGDYENAISQFAFVNTEQGYFYLGNSYAHLQKYQEALESYDESLRHKAEFPEATANRELVAALLEREKEDEEEEGPPGDPSFDPDEIKFDEKAEKGKKGKMDEFKLKPEQMAEIWMRNIQTTPADFLRLKFDQQAQAVLKNSE